MFNILDRKNFFYAHSNFGDLNAGESMNSGRWRKLKDDQQLSFLDEFQKTCLLSRLLKVYTFDEDLKSEDSAFVDRTKILKSPITLRKLD